MSQIRDISRRLAAALLLGAAAFPLYSLSYTVRPADTLFGLALRYDIPQAWIVRANGLEGEGLRIGQELEIPVDGFSSVTVRPGDTLTGLSVLFDVAVDEIMEANGLSSADLRIGQKLTIPEAVPAGRHRVGAGDTLTGIAGRYGLSVASLKAYNGLSSDIIRPGDELIIAAPRPETRRIGPGESLWTIADEYGLTMDQLREWNGITGDVIHPGELLVLFPGIDPGTAAAAPEVALAAVKPERPPQGPRDDIPRFGEYFYSRPKADSQPDNTYWEGADASAMTDYRRALKVLDLFERNLETLPRLSSSLAGWHIVIDPGHGGLDPGAIVTVKDGAGNPLTVTEDEYAYDVSLRMYRALHRHGASVSLTILSPDHQIREGEDARQTFVHRKNEVYNDESHNGNAGWRPVGTVDGLDLRKDIAGDQIRNLPSMAKRKGTLFISIHADNTPDLPAGRAVLYDGAGDAEVQASRELASVMAANLGGGSFIKQQPLRVLRENPADAAVLVEVRNVHYERNCWALRSAELREQDALMVVDGILDWAR